MGLKVGFVRSVWESRGMRSVIAALAAVGVLAGVGTPAADAKDRVEYIYRIGKVSAAKGIKAPMEHIRKGLLKGVTKAGKISATFPEGAPDPKKEPKRFKKYLKKKRLKAYKVNLEVIQYEETVEELDDRGHKRVAVRISVRLFGETIPDRVMAFAGKGSATVKLDVGRKVRDRDREVANHDAIEVAIDQAIGESLRKLSMPPPSKRKRRRRGKK